MCLVVAQPTRLPHRCKRNQPAGLVVNDPELVLNGSLYFKWIHSQISHMGIVFVTSIPVIILSIHWWVLSWLPSTLRLPSTCFLPPSKPSCSITQKDHPSFISGRPILHFYRLKTTKEAAYQVPAVCQSKYACVAPIWYPKYVCFLARWYLSQPFKTHMLVKNPF